MNTAAERDRFDRDEVLVGAAGSSEEPPYYECQVLTRKNARTEGRMVRVRLLRRGQPLARLDLHPRMLLAVLPLLEKACRELLGEPR